jgi:hypothetical protein
METRGHSDKDNWYNATVQFEGGAHGGVTLVQPETE